MREIFRRQQEPTIDQVVNNRNRKYQERELRREQRSMRLARTLGDRAIAGEEFGLTGFMAMAFPNFKPDTDEYEKVIRAYNDIRSIKPGSLIEISSASNVYGIKAEGDNGGVTFDVYPTVAGPHAVRANVLTSLAIYNHKSPEDATLHGLERPYPVSFVDSFISDEVRDVRVAVPVAGGYEYEDDGNRVYGGYYFDHLRSIADTAMNGV